MSRPRIQSNQLLFLRRATRVLTYEYWSDGLWSSCYWRVRVAELVSCACASRNAACLFSQAAQVIVEFLQNIISFSYLVPISLYVTIGNPLQSLAPNCFILCCSVPVPCCTPVLSSVFFTRCLPCPVFSRAHTDTLLAHIYTSIF